MMNTETQHRNLLPQSKRVVVKVGTNLLVDKNGKINQKSISAIAKELARLRKKNKDVILVSSGAIGAGLPELGFKKRPTSLSDLQTAASIGQLILLNYYNKYFKKHHCKISQILLTHSDLKDRKRHLNARNTLLNLLQHKIIPIINENDAVANEEIKIGDNDVLSSLVATLIDADLLILLTTPDGLRKPISDEETERVSYLANIDDKVFEFITGKQNYLSTGGMGSKLQAAQMAAKSGALVVIASGFQKNIVQKILLGEDVGTLIGNKESMAKLNKRKQ